MCGIYLIPISGVVSRLHLKVVKTTSGFTVGGKSSMITHTAVHHQSLKIKKNIIGIVVGNISLINLSLKIY